MIDLQSPTSFADKMGIEYSRSVNQKHKKEHGQFFTPVEIAGLMGRLVSYNKETCTILDPGCGTGILSCALIENLVYTNKSLKELFLTLYETDTELLPYLSKTMEYLKNWLTDLGIDFTCILKTDDFILNNAHYFNTRDELFSENQEKFDIVISNPPYFKLPINDKRAIASKEIINGHPNIYAMFMALSAKMLYEGGQLVLITPRSYASGGYFKLFRQYFFNLITIEKVHLFVSRKETFNRDKVLQETVIIKGLKEEPREDSSVEIRSSVGINDILKPVIKKFALGEILNLRSDDKVLYLPTSDNDEAILHIFKAWSGTLTKYNIGISTGPVVAFRAWDYIHEVYENGQTVLAPLLWLHNIKKMEVLWPDHKPERGQYIRVEKQSKSLLLPNKNYVLLRRFSAKDDKSRLIAAPHFSSSIETEFVGIENKVNYIYKRLNIFEKSEMIGICALLNSRLYDQYFRMFNGNVNVSATELREIPFPPMEEIKELGNTLILSNDFSEENINKTVNSFTEYQEFHV
ncbi:MAG: Eco57I restriction-modification methylase domain-containing protein [Ignavibacteriaceae bacterium]|nr:Eco57I restriction-modification methylase domain-containing protein [Ignavibacteriaceae bacterium]